MQISIIAAGMGGTETLTLAACEAIERAELLIGARRLLAPYADTGKELLCSWKPEEIAARLREGTQQYAAVLMSGDTGFYSGAKRLLPLLSGLEVQVIPGVSSPVYLCAKTGLSWEHMHFVSLHGTTGNVAVHVRSHKICCFLLGGDITAAMLCRRLCDYGLAGTTVYIGENLGSPSEAVFKGVPADFCSHPAQTLCTVIVENPTPCVYLPSGIPDSAFEREQIPMTKAEVRCCAAAALCVGQQDVCWDIGCGTGSVSVELALRCPEGQVFAIDRNSAAVRLTTENAKKFSCDNITVTEGLFPDVSLPVPDKVFLGGTGGRLPDILEMVYQMNPAARIALTAVSLETLSEALRIFDRYSRMCEVTQIAVTRTRKIGGHTMLQGLNPVYLIIAQS